MHEQRTKPAPVPIPTTAPPAATDGWRDPLRLAVRGLGALALLAVGAVHLQQFSGLYSQIPVIGALFVLNFAGATAIGLSLLAPVRRLARRRGRAILALLAAAGIALAAVAFAFLAISERAPLFGFMEPGYDPAAIAAARAAEVATVVLLGAFLTLELVPGGARRTLAGRSSAGNAIPKEIKR